MNEKPQSMSLHSIEDPFELALFTLLREHFGEDVNGTLSIDSTKAVLAILPIASQMIAAWSPKERRQLFKAFEEGTTRLSHRLLTEYQQRTTSPPQ